MLWLLVLSLFIAGVMGDVSCHITKNGFPTIRKLDTANVKEVSGSSLYTIHWNCTSTGHAWVSYNNKQRVNMPGTFFLHNNSIRTISYVTYDHLQLLTNDQIQFNLEGTGITCPKDQRTCILDNTSIRVTRERLVSDGYSFADFFSVERASINKATFALILILVLWVFIVEEILFVRVLDKNFRHYTFFNINHKLNKFLS